MAEEIDYDKTEEISDIQKGFELFDVDSKGLIDPLELKEILEELNLQNRNPFFYEIIQSLCKNKEIQKKGGITSEEFISFLEEKTSDSESKEGIERIFNVFSEGNKNESIPVPNFYQSAKEVRDDKNEKELKELVQESHMGGKELDFDEFYEIMKGENKGNKKKKENNKKGEVKVNKTLKTKKEETPEKFLRVGKEKESTSKKKNNRYQKDYEENKEKPFDSKDYVLVETIVTREKIVGEIDPSRKEQKKEEESPNKNGSAKGYSFRRRLHQLTNSEEKLTSLSKEKDGKNNFNSNKVNDIIKSEEISPKKYHKRFRETKTTTIESNNQENKEEVNEKNHFNTTKSVNVNKAYSSSRRRGKI